MALIVNMVQYSISKIDLVSYSAHDGKVRYIYIYIYISRSQNYPNDPVGET